MTVLYVQSFWARSEAISRSRRLRQLGIGYGALCKANCSMTFVAKNFLQQGEK